MADEQPRQIPGDQQGQAGQPDASMTTHAGSLSLAGGIGEQGAQPGAEYGGVVPAWQQPGPQAGQATVLPPAAPVAVRQALAQPVPRQAARQEQPTPALEAAMIERREGGFGGVTIRIQERGLAAAAVVGGVTVGATYVASQATQSPAAIVGAGIVAGTISLAALIMGNRQQTEEAIRRAVEKDGHVKVEGIEEGSLLVQVKFLSMAGYWVIRALNEKIHQGTDRTCLQLLLEDELQRIGWTGPIQVGLEGWWFADEEGQEEEQEDAAGTEQEEERWEWAGMREKQSAPASMTTEGDSGLPEDVSSVAAMSITSAEEVEEGPLKWLRAMVQKHKDSPTAQRYITAYRSWEKGAEILTSSGYTDLGGLKALVQGFMQDAMESPIFTSKVLYEQSWLNLNKAKLNQLITPQLQADPTDSTCLLLTALQLPHGDSRVQALQQVVAAILQHGPGDWLYQHLHHIYCYLGVAIWLASPQPQPSLVSRIFKRTDQPPTDLRALAKAMSAMASSLMYNQDHVNTIYYTAALSKEVSETEAIRQFEHFLRLAPECDHGVPSSHYRLATLYGQQQDRQKVIHHYNKGQQTEDNMLPGSVEILRSIKDPAWKVYEEAMAQGKPK